MGEILLGNIKGDTGNGLTIFDYYSTFDELIAAVPTPSAGDAYGVGEETSYDIYIYSPNKGWVNNGTLQPDTKVSSTYSGNGSAAGITVNIGGIGKALLLYGSDDSDDSPFIVTRSGAIGKDGNTPLAFSRDVIKFENGVLTIKTDSAYFNAESTYSYQVL